MTDHSAYSMSLPFVPKFEFGDEVVVYGRNGREQFRGKVVGRSRGRQILYDIAPEDGGYREFSIPENRMRNVVAKLEIV